MVLRHLRGDRGSSQYEPVFEFVVAAGSAESLII